MGLVKHFTTTERAYKQTLFGMDSNTPHAASIIDDLFTLRLVDGLKAESAGKHLFYKVVHLRETSVADERMANRLAERVMNVGGVPKLLVSEADFRYALTMRHIEAFACDGQKIPQGVIDLELFGKLSSHDLGLIEERVFLITMAAEVRYGALTQDAFDELVSGAKTQAAQPSPQPSGQAAELGQADPESESGPALLASYVGGPAGGTAAGHGR